MKQNVQIAYPMNILLFKDNAKNALLLLMDALHAKINKSVKLVCKNII
jgi:hypothetical protein